MGATAAKQRYGKANEHNAMIPRDYWIEPDESNGRSAARPPLNRSVMPLRPACAISFDTIHFARQSVMPYEKRLGIISSNSRCAHRHRCSCLPALGTSHRGQECSCHNLRDLLQRPIFGVCVCGSIPFFVALYRAFGLAGHVRENRAFSQVTVDALRAIKHWMMAFIGFVAGGVVFVIVFGDKDDMPAGIFMSFIVALPSSVIAIAAAMFARNIQNAIRSETWSG